MTFNLCPDDGPPRLWRFVAPGELGYSGGRPIVSMLLEENNLLIIDRELYDQLGWYDQHCLLRTHHAFELV